jgi:hypothetical protein
MPLSIYRKEEINEGRNYGRELKGLILYLR